MAELKNISAELLRQRRDLDQAIETTSARSNETAGLIDKIEELRRRAEETQRKRPDGQR